MPHDQSQGQPGIVQRRLLAEDLLAELFALGIGNLRGFQRDIEIVGALPDERDGLVTQDGGALLVSLGVDL